LRTNASNPALPRISVQHSGSSNRWQGVLYECVQNFYEAMDD